MGKSEFKQWGSDLFTDKRSQSKRVMTNNLTHFLVAFRGKEMKAVARLSPACSSPPLSDACTRCPVSHQTGNLVPE